MPTSVVRIIQIYSHITTGTKKQIELDIFRLCCYSDFIAEVRRKITWDKYISVQFLPAQHEDVGDEKRHGTDHSSEMETL